MFFPYDSANIRYSGRFSLYDGAMTATAAGSNITIAYTGDTAVLHFDIRTNTFPMPHLWIRVDGGVKTEVPLDRFIRVISAKGEHAMEIIYKGGKETLNRWYHPLEGKIGFEGFDADGAGILPVDARKTIELVGDSITEGVLIDPYTYYEDDQNNRPYEDDANATYAYLTATALGLRTLHMGYGAVGATRSGCGSVPKAVEAYPYCFDGASVTYDHPDYILVNHGANDWGREPEVYKKDYRDLLVLIRKTHPDAKIIALSAFCGAHEEDLRALIEEFNHSTGDDVFFINGAHWIPLEPLHPHRDGHQIIADHLIPILREKYGL